MLILPSFILYLKSKRQKNQQADDWQRENEINLAHFRNLENVLVIIQK